MKKLIGKHFFSLIIVTLLLIIFLQKCDDDRRKVSPEGNKSDTTVLVINHLYKDTTKSKPTFIKGERDTILESSVYYLPSSNYDSLYVQYNTLKEAYLSRNMYRDSVQIDTFGYIKVVDTLQKNQMVGRSFIKDLKIPEKTITITNTIYPDPKRQVYIGGGIFGNKDNIAGQVQAGLLLKNKKDQIFGVSTGINANGQVQYGISSYWKIKIK
jgi:hypothetical protein